MTDRNWLAMMALLLTACATTSTPVTASPVGEGAQRYFSDMHSKIASCAQLPASLTAEQKRLLEVQVRVVVDENGAVQNAAIEKSSGSVEYDEAILQAIHCAEPFARPDAESGSYVARGLVLSFKP
jgi:TonB family protein